jgi:hypothetical protein
MSIKNVNVINDVQINKSLVTAKGDLIVGTGNGTVDILPVGADTYCIIADSSTATGLKYGLLTASHAFIVGGFNNSDNSFGTRINKLSGDNICNCITYMLCISNRGLGAATLSNSAYYAGGYATSVNTKAIYKITSDVYYGAVSASLSTSRYADAGVLSASAYFTGGNITVNRVIDKLTSDSACGAVAANLGTSNSSARATALSNSIYYIGGVNVGANYSYAGIRKLTNDSTCFSIPIV